MARTFSINWDYRCPFAYNAHSAIVAALRAGEPLDVTFVPFSLDQGRLEPGEVAIWDRPPAERGSGMTALLFGLAVRDHFPDRFPDFHLAAFAARHDEARAIAEHSVMREVAASVGLDPDAVADRADDPATLARLATEHTASVDEHDVWGTPTFITATSATYVRFMERGRVDDLLRVLDLLDVETINEFKRTRVAR
ncbi:MAG: DsbA family protein [Actinomycetes bacterium]